MSATNHAAGAASAASACRALRYDGKGLAAEAAPTTAAAAKAARATAAPAAPDAFESGIYEGWIRHRRFAPRRHAFRYRIAMLLVDLAETDALFAGRWLWSRDRRNVAEFRRSDFLGDPALPLDQAVRDRVQEATGVRPDGPIRLLAHLRYAGHVFNPVSFYYCHARDGRTLQAVVAEITNTPWKQRHAYVLPVADAAPRGRALAWDFDKAFHVSPFMPMQRRYAWRFTAPGDDLRVHMDVLDAEGREFDATLVLQRRPWTPANLRRVLWRYPLMTLQVVWGIHWQALRLWWKGVPVHDHPAKAHPPARTGRNPAAPPTDRSTDAR